MTIMLIVIMVLVNSSAVFNLIKEKKIKGNKYSEALVSIFDVRRWFNSNLSLMGWGITHLRVLSV